jgi:hypothetical protein
MLDYGLQTAATQAKRDAHAGGPGSLNAFPALQPLSINPQPPGLSFQITANGKQISKWATSTKQSQYFFLPANKLRFFMSPRKTGESPTLPANLLSSARQRSCLRLDSLLSSRTGNQFSKLTRHIAGSFSVSPELHRHCINLVLPIREDRLTIPCPYVINFALGQPPRENTSLPTRGSSRAELLLAAEVKNPVNSWPGSPFEIPVSAPLGALGKRRESNTVCPEKMMGKRSDLRMRLLMEIS